jgi:hypothetical protein
MGGGTHTGYISWIVTDMNGIVCTTGYLARGVYQFKLIQNVLTCSSDE